MRVKGINLYGEVNGGGANDGLTIEVAKIIII